MELAARPRLANSLGIRLGEHVAIVGITGCGKTHFAKGWLEYLRRQYPHARRYILDSTEDGLQGIIGRLDVRGNRCPDLLRDPAFTQVWTPDTDVPELYNEWFERILYARQPAVVFVDEIASIGGRGGEALDGFIKLLKQGRKHDITVMSLTQEIARVTPTVFRQMKHFILFYINPETYDLAMARKYLNIEKDAQRPPLGKYGFFYRRTDGPFAMHEYPSMQAFFKHHI